MWEQLHIVSPNEKTCSFSQNLQWTSYLNLFIQRATFVTLCFAFILYTFYSWFSRKSSVSSSATHNKYQTNHFIKTNPYNKLLYHFNQRATDHCLTDCVMRSKIADKHWRFCFWIFQISSFSKEKITIEPNIPVMRWNFIIQYTVQSINCSLFFISSFLFDSAIVSRARSSAIDRLHNDRREEEKTSWYFENISIWNMNNRFVYNWEWLKVTHHEHECLRVCLCVYWRPHIAQWQMVPNHRNWNKLINMMWFNWCAHSLLHPNIYLGTNRFLSNPIKFSLSFSLCRKKNDYWKMFRMP